MIKVEGTFPDGIIVNGVIYREFALAEEVFRHSLEMANDTKLDMSRMGDDVYFQACLYARRLAVAGVSMTPESVLELSGADGRELLRAVAQVEEQRKAFRDAAEAAQVAPGGGVEAGIAA